MSSLKKVLVANRGEIALRVFRTAKERGMQTVAVYSDADRNAMHVLQADEAVHIGASEATSSYLVADRILEAAIATGCDCIHPGYGFLSERASFAEACNAAGLTFIGPSAEAMRQLGDKISSKKLATETNVPLTPGFFDATASEDEIVAAAKQIGLPVMLKASAGGGGRGMRAVHDADAILNELRLASQEALNAFGDGTMMVEKLIDRPRHIEVQLIADHHGNVAALYERECSLQRRNQKVVEEAPSSAMTNDLWQRMRASAIALAKAANYTGAGTVEFMVDASTGEYYFLEVNARLQVEHPVTELITGLDLVELQFLVAEGADITQHIPAAMINGDRGAISGHAIEIRLVAEDPAREFLPSVGPIVGWSMASGPGIRVDSGFEAGSEVSRYYDSLIAKVIAHGANREQCRRRAILAAQNTHVLGVKTNLEFVIDVLRSDHFVHGNMDTGLLNREFGNWATDSTVPNELASIYYAKLGSSVSQNTASGRLPTAWGVRDGFRNTGDVT